MKQIFVSFLIAILLFPQVAFAKQYTIFAPFAQKYEHTQMTEEILYNVSANHVLASYAHDRNIDAWTKSIFGENITKIEIICLAPEVDGKELSEKATVMHPWAELLFPVDSRPHYSDDSYVDFIKRLFWSPQYVQGMFNQKPKRMLRAHMYSRDKQSGQSCEDEKLGNIRENIIANIEKGDVVRQYIQYPEGKSLRINNQTIEIQKNFASYSVIKKLAIRGELLCYANDLCNVQKVEITKLNGQKIDVTREVLEFLQRVREYDYYEDFMIPADTYFIEYVYSK